MNGEFQATLGAVTTAGSSWKKSRRASEISTWRSPRAAVDTEVSVYFLIMSTRALASLTGTTVTAFWPAVHKKLLIDVVLLCPVGV